MLRRFFILFMLLVFVGCASNEKSSEKPTVTVTTSFISDMVKNLVDESLINLEVVIPAGEDAHVYVAKPDDLKKLEKADLLMYHGLHFESQMMDYLEEKGKAVTVNFPKEDILLMEEDGAEEVDPHFWFNIKLYKLAFEEVRNQLLTLLPSNNDQINKNFDSYIVKLDELDKEVRQKLDEIPRESRYLITPHDAFGYFSKVYEIEVKSPQGVNTGSEVSNKDIEDTANFIVENKVKAIFVERTNNPEKMKKIQEVVKAKGFEVKIVSGEGQELYADSLAPLGQAGDTYLDMYKNNINLIVDNLK